MLSKGMAGVRVAILDVSQPPPHLCEPPISHVPALRAHKLAVSSENVKYFRTNVGDPDSVATTANAIRDMWGDPTMIVNNAGVRVSLSPSPARA